MVSPLFAMHEAYANRISVNACVPVLVTNPARPAGALVATAVSSSTTAASTGHTRAMSFVSAA